ncbi:hypothetical protein [Rhodococcus sp. IEGM 1374]|uniref:hypothetical protein n=1 Tax=Rhodococcus sp. IEGM 1374 TaxID=3082221 RepID=UPI0029531B52|nr:hypothetical protein [Rhodococcus sp. IEGM 1374]MDV7991611.1 hypothetical protein [Rhodococcus sp. IEGM 1374]
MNTITVLAQTPTPSGAGAEPPHATDFETLFSYITWAGTVLGVVTFIVGGALLTWQRSIGRTERAEKAGMMLFGGLALAVLPSGLRFLLFDTDTSTEAEATDTAMPTGTAVPTSAPVPAVSPAEPASPTEPVDWTPVIYVLGILAALVVVAAAGYLVVRTRHRILDRRAAQATLASDFVAAKTVYAQVADAYAEYLADPYAIFTRPLLDDLDQPRTAAFITAFTDAGALNTDTCPATGERVQAFATAARAAQEAWRAADTYARAIGLRVQTDDAKRTVRRIRSALDLALDDSAAAGERASAMKTVQRLSNGLMTIPDRIYVSTKTAIESATRKQLTR